MTILDIGGGFTGSDDEYRKLGAIYVLIALTMVSTGAREAMPWLYESVSIFQNMYYNCQKEKSDKIYSNR